MTPEEYASLLEQARQERDPARARALLSKALKIDPRSEVAWLLFSEVAEKEEHAIYCLEQVLKLNPHNLLAAQQLEVLQSSPGPLQAAVEVAEPQSVQQPEPELANPPESPAAFESQPISEPELEAIQAEPSELEAEALPVQEPAISQPAGAELEMEPSLASEEAATPADALEQDAETSDRLEPDLAVPQPGLVLESSTAGNTQPVRRVAPVQPQPASVAAIPQSEDILKKERVHWATGLGSILLLAFGLVVSYVSLLNRGTSVAVLDVIFPFLLIIGLLLVLLGVVGVFRLLVVLFSHSFTLTSQKIIVHKGRNSSDSFEMPLTKLETVRYRQSLFGRLFGYGSIILATRAGVRKVLKGVQHPAEFYQAIQVQMTRVKANLT